MASRRLITLTARASHTPMRQFHHARPLLSLNDRGHPNTSTHRTAQTEKPLNPHLTNTTSTIGNDMPSAGKHSAPPELLSSVDGAFKPKDDAPGNTERMTGGTQKSAAGVAGEKGTDQELNVGEMEGASFKVEPLRRVGEDASTMRARLLYQSRKRGTLESELLMSTFASANLATMTKDQLHQYDLFLDENDWDIYYWATQEPTPTSLETAEGATDTIRADTPVASPRPGEWAQTVGTFKPAYRPVPQRWKESEILLKLRDHVKKRSNDGLGFMPPITHFN